MASEAIIASTSYTYSVASATSFTNSRVVVSFERSAYIYCIPLHIYASGKVEYELAVLRAEAKAYKHNCFIQNGRTNGP